jgi:hypothetical protein
MGGGSGSVGGLGNGIGGGAGGGGGGVGGDEGPLLQPLLGPHVAGPDSVGGSRRSPNISFSPAENHLILCDGVLWDDREAGGRMVVHRFDRLSHGGSNFGAFHPNGNDVLLDGTVWDLRTHSLKTMMPGVEQCAVKFSACGDVLYAYRPGGFEDAEGGFRANQKRAREITCFQVRLSLRRREGGEGGGEGGRGVCVCLRGSVFEERVGMCVCVCLCLSVLVAVSSLPCDGCNKAQICLTLCLFLIRN